MNIASHVPSWLADSGIYYVMIFHQGGHYLYANDLFKRHFGALSHGVELPVFLEDVLVHQNALRTCLHTQSKATIELRLYTPEKTIKWLQWEFSLLTATEVLCIGVDVTLQKQQAQDLENAEILAIIAGHTSNLIAVLDIDYQITWINEEFNTLSGYTLPEVLGKNILNLFNYSKPTLPAPAEVGLHFEALNHTKDTRSYWLDLEIEPLHDEAKELIGFIAVGSDVTARKEAEAIALTSQSQLFSTINNTPNVAIQWFDEDGIVTSWNPASEMLYGWTAQEAVGKTLDQLIYTKESAENFSKLLVQIKQTGKACKAYETYAHDKANNAKWILSTAFSIPLENGKVGFVCMDVDITAQKQFEQELLESKEKYKSVVSAIAEGLVVQNTEDKVLMANQAALNILGLTMEQLLGKDSFDPQWKALHEDGSPFKPEDHPSMITLKTGQNVDNIIMNVHTGKGDRKYISINSRPIYNHKNEMYAVVASFTDITERKENERKIIAQNEVLRNIAWQQSHEVRRPVATILGLINLIEDEFQRDALFSVEYLGYLQKTIKELDAIIHKIVEKTYIFDELETV